MAEPSDYELFLPEGWFRIPLEPEKRMKSIDALVERQLSGIDDAPHVRRLLRQELLDNASRAFDEGGIELYLSLQRAGSLTVPASLLISLGRPPRGGRPAALADLAELLAADVAQEREVAIVELKAGTALRIRGTCDPETDTSAGKPTDGADYAMQSVTVDYQVQVPGTDALLLLAFSTPLVPIADAMVELFDAIASSLTWKGGV
jgi:hypothetical protein